MPTKKPPVPTNPRNGQTPPELPPRGGEGEPSFIPETVPNAPLGAGIPDTFHFANAGALSTGRVQNIKAWIMANQPDRVIVWYDRSSRLVNRLYEKLVEFALKEAAHDRPEALANPITFEGEIRDKLNRFWIDKLPQDKYGQSLENAIKSFLLELGDNETDIRDYLEGQDRLERELNTLPNTKVINPDVDPINVQGEYLFETSGNHALGAFYKSQLFQAGNLERVNDLMTVAALDELGGKGIDSRLSPELNQAVFTRSDALPLPTERLRSLKGYARTQAVYQKLGLGDGQTTDYLGQLTRDRGGQESQAGTLEARQIVADVATADRDHLLKPLGQLPQSPEGYLVSDRPVALTDRPPGILASPTGALESLKEDMIFGLNMSVEYLKYKNIPGEIFNEGAFNKAVKDGFRERFPNAAESDARQYLRGVKSDIAGAYRSGVDRSGAVTGAQLWRRKADQASDSLSHYNAHTEAMQREGIGNSINPKAYESIRHYDRQIIITLQDDPDITAYDAYRFGKHPKDTQWLFVDKDGTTVTMDGEVVIPGPDTRLILSGHGEKNRSIAGYGPEELAQLVSRVLKGQKVKRIVLSGCELECSISESVLDNLGGAYLEDSAFTARFYRELETMGIAPEAISIPNKAVITDPSGHQAYAIERNGKLVAFENKPALTRLDITPRQRNSGTVYYAQPKKGESDALLALRDQHEDLPTRGERTLDAQLRVSGALSELQVRQLLQVYSDGKGSGNLLLPAEANTLLYSVADREGKIVITDDSGLSLEGIRFALYQAGHSENLNDWVVKLKTRFPEAAENLETNFNKLADPEAGFSSLKQRVLNDGFDFVYQSPISHDGAAIINNQYSEGFSGIQIDAVDIPAGENFEEDVRAQIDSLTLLSDDQTRILVGNSADDIALHPSTEGSALAKVQEGIHDFRRDMTSVRLANHEGYHNVIALDETSLPAARKIAESAGDKGRALLLDTEHGVLLDDHGRVVVMVEGGALNRLSLVGSKETLDEFSGALLAEQVVLFARDGSVGSVTVQPVLEDGEGFDSASAFADLAVLGADSPWQDKAGYVRLHPLVSDDHGQLIESDSLRVGVPGKPDGMELDNGYLKTALGLAEAKQPGAFEAGLRSRLATIRKEAVGAEAGTFRSLTLDYASKVHLLHAEFEVFRAAMDQFYAEHPDQLSPHDMPLLSSRLLKWWGIVRKSWQVERLYRSTISGLYRCIWDAEPAESNLN